MINYYKYELKIKEYYSLKKNDITIIFDKIYSKFSKDTIKNMKKSLKKMREIMNFSQVQNLQCLQVPV